MMAIRTYEITLDAKNDILPEIIFGRQGDKTGAVQINGTIVDGGFPYNLTGKSLLFKATTAKGTAVVVDGNNFNIVDASNGKFTYLIPNALWNEAGRIDNAYFSIYDDNEAQAESTLGLIFVVKKAIDMTQESANDYITIVDQTLQSLTANIGKLQHQVDAITNAYEAGEFYSKSEVDTKVKNVQDGVTAEVKNVKDEVTANAQIGKVHFGYMSEIIDQLQNGWTVTDPEHTSYRMICIDPAKREAMLFINCIGPLGDQKTPTIPAFGGTTMFTLKKTVIEQLYSPINAFSNYNGWGTHMMSEIHTDNNSIGVHSSTNSEINGGGWAISFICNCKYAEGVVFS